MTGSFAWKGFVYLYDRSDVVVWPIMVKLLDRTVLMVDNTAWPRLATEDEKKSDLAAIDATFFCPAQVHPPMDEVKAQAILGACIKPDGALAARTEYMRYQPSTYDGLAFGCSTVCLDGNFSDDFLEAVVFWMRRHRRAPGLPTQPSPAVSDV